MATLSIFVQKQEDFEIRPGKLSRKINAMYTLRICLPWLILLHTELREMTT